MRTALIISVIIMGICCTFVYSTGALSKKPDVRSLVVVHGEQRTDKKGAPVKEPIIAYYDDNVRVSQRESYICIEGKARRLYVDKGMVEVSREINNK